LPLSPVISSNIFLIQGGKYCTKDTNLYSMMLRSRCLPVCLRLITIARFREYTNSFVRMSICSWNEIVYLIPETFLSNFSDSRVNWQSSLILQHLIRTMIVNFIIGFLIIAKFADIPLVSVRLIVIAKFFNSLLILL